MAKTKTNVVKKPQVQEVTVKETVAPPQKLWEVKDRMYYLTNGKKPLSKMIKSAGIYYFKKGSDYVKSANQMIDKDIRTNNEFYICPIYNELLEYDKQISTYECDVHNKHMLGTPEELQIFLDKIENEEVRI